MKREFTSIPLRVPHEAQVYLPANPKRVFLLLHGYKQDGDFIFEQLRSILPDDCAIVAPNGPFIVPVQKDEGFVPKYAWYFFDPYKKTYYINFDPAANYLKDILVDLDIYRKPITVIGYSQGGYLAPKLSELLDSIDTVIGLACVFRTARFEFKQKVMINQINSVDDSIIDYETAKEQFQELRDKGNVGQFITLNDVGHRLDENYINELKLLI